MRDHNHLHAAYIDTAADPRLHGIARGLVQHCAVPENDDMPDDLNKLLAKVKAAVDVEDERNSSH